MSITAERLQEAAKYAQTPQAWTSDRPNQPTPRCHIRLELWADGIAVIAMDSLFGKSASTLISWLTLEQANINPIILIIDKMRKEMRGLSPSP